MELETETSPTVCILRTAIGATRSFLTDLKSYGATTGALNLIASEIKRKAQSLISFFVASSFVDERHPEFVAAFIEFEGILEPFFENNTPQRVVHDSHARTSYFKDLFTVVGHFIAALSNLEKELEKASVQPESVCTICLEPPNEDVKQLSCTAKHMFHGACILEWQKVSLTCPLCREDVERLPSFVPLDDDAFSYVLRLDDVIDVQRAKTISQASTAAAYTKQELWSTFFDSESKQIVNTEHRMFGHNFKVYSQFTPIINSKVVFITSAVIPVFFKALDTDMRAAIAELIKSTERSRLLIEIAKDRDGRKGVADSNLTEPVVGSTAQVLEAHSPTAVTPKHIAGKPHKKKRKSRAKMNPTKAVNELLQVLFQCQIETATRGASAVSAAPPQDILPTYDDDGIASQAGSQVSASDKFHLAEAITHGPDSFTGAALAAALCGLERTDDVDVTLGALVDALVIADVGSLERIVDVCLVKNFHTWLASVDERSGALAALLRALSLLLLAPTVRGRLFVQLSESFPMSSPLAHGVARLTDLVLVVGSSNAKDVDVLHSAALFVFALALCADQTHPFLNGAADLLQQIGLRSKELPELRRLVLVAQSMIGASHPYRETLQTVPWAYWQAYLKLLGWSVPPTNQQEQSDEALARKLCFEREGYMRAFIASTTSATVLELVPGYHRPRNDEGRRWQCLVVVDGPVWENALEGMQMELARPHGGPSFELALELVDKSVKKPANAQPYPVASGPPPSDVTEAYNIAIALILGQPGVVGIAELPFSVVDGATAGGWSLGIFVRRKGFVVAGCDDFEAAHYTIAGLAVHVPITVLGATYHQQLPVKWPQRRPMSGQDEARQLHPELLSGSGIGAHWTNSAGTEVSGFGGTFGINAWSIDDNGTPTSIGFLTAGHVVRKKYEYVPATPGAGAQLSGSLGEMVTHPASTFRPLLDGDSPVSAKDRFVNRRTLFLDDAPTSTTGMSRAIAVLPPMEVPISGKNSSIGDIAYVPYTVDPSELKKTKFAVDSGEVWTTQLRTVDKAVRVMGGAPIIEKVDTDLIRSTLSNTGVSLATSVVAIKVGNTTGVTAGHFFGGRHSAKDVDSFARTAMPFAFPYINMMAVQSPTQLLFSEKGDSGALVCSWYRASPEKCFPVGILAGIMQTDSGQVLTLLTPLSDDALHELGNLKVL